MFDKKMMEEFCYGGKLVTEKSTCHEYFEMTVEKYPNKVALSMNDIALTYSELNKKANQMARRLVSCGVGPDVCVAIIGEKEIETIISILAIWKAGGAFVSIDSNLGEERVSYIIHDCKPVLLLTGRKKLNFVPEIPTLLMFDEKNFVGEDDNLEHIVDENNLAYFVYTSGSTGQPKGVMQIHKGTIRFIYHVLNQDICSEDTLLQFSSFSFAMSVWEMIITFFAGARLQMIPEQYILDIKSFEEYIQKHKVNILLLPRQYIEHVKCFDGVTKIFTAGAEITNEIFEYIPKGIQFIQMYGTSEVSGVITEWKYDGREYESKLPVGKPMPNCYVYIVKEDRLCSVGEIGDIYIAGECISRGYISKPELTNKVFVPNMFGDGVMYATGDLGRWLPDGNIVYHGRKDNQIKLRGYRIELGEIEAVLRSKDNILEAAVVVKEDAHQEKIICAYITASSIVDVHSLKNELRKALPDYMIPAKIIQLEEMPLTISRKLDKNRLPDIDMKLMSTFVPAETKLQKVLVKMYEKILNIDKIGINDNFFDLGGHSLSASKLLNYLNIECGVRLTIKSIFEHPCISELSKEIENCKIKSSQHSSIAKAKTKEKYVMSPVQRGIYFTCQINVGIAYNNFSGYRLDSALDIERLRYGFLELTKRHEMLRTSFHIEKGELVQRVHDNVEINFEYIISDVAEEELIQDFCQTFDLSIAPLMRVCLVKQKNGYLLLLDIHHIITDGTSNALIIDELSKLYNNELLIPKDLDYTDYSEWMNHRNIEKQKRFWLKEYKEAIPIMDFPLDMTRPKIIDFSGKTISTFLNPALRGRISRLGKNSNTTDYMVFLASFMVLLEQYSGQEDIVVGTPISGRVSPDTENMFGMFVNSLPMRGKPKKDKMFHLFLKELKEFSLFAYENQEYSFEELVRELQIKRDLSRNPMFDVMLVMQNMKDQELNLTSVNSVKVRQINPTAKFDITIFINNREGQYEVELEYCSKLFDPKTMEVMLNHYVQILEYVTDNPDIKIGNIPLASKNDINIICNEFNNTSTEVKEIQNVLNLIEKQAALYPDRIALYNESWEISFKEMNQKANQLANELVEMGVRKGDFVAVISERSIELVIGIFAILKVGGVFVPITTDFPKERIQYILNDCNPTVVLCDNTVEISSHAPIINLESVRDLKGSDKEHNIELNPDDLAYMIYTSGTTGKQKGTMIQHCGLSNYISYGMKHYVTKLPTAPLFTNISFDLTITTIFLPLCCGGKIKIYNGPVDEMIKDIFVNNEFTLIKCTPQHLKFANDYKKELLSNLETMILGGEELDTATAEETLNNFGRHIKIHNEYGPTEATIGCCDFIYTGDLSKRTVSIGKPISNTQIYIMDEIQLCGIGIPGELCIAGAGVAKGYWKKEDMTSSKFISNPFGEGLLYRTGDKARWLPDGTLEYLGRIDEQVKILGYRIEPSEISNGIRKQKGIKDAIVVVNEAKTGEKQLCAYYTADCEIEIATVKEALRKELPEYMIPAYIMQLETIPLTDNGKVDKHKLPEITINLSRDYKPPRNQKESIVSKIFTKVLGINQVGIFDNFFELGGHSLKAAKVLNYIEEAFGVRLVLNDIFKNPTIADLVQSLDIKNRKPRSKGLRKADVQDYYMAAPVQKGIYILSSFEKNTIYNMPYAAKLMGSVDIDKLHHAFCTVVERYEILRTGFELNNGEIIQRIYDKITLDFAVFHSEDETFHLQELVEPFDLGGGSLLRIRVIQNKKYSILFIDIHHIVSDGISQSLILEEVSKVYNGQKVIEPVFQYKDYSQWFNNLDMSAAKAYWLERYSDGIPVLDLPTDFSRPQIQSFQGSSRYQSLGTDLSSSIKSLAVQTGATEYMVFLSAFMIMLGQYSRQKEVVVGCPISGRFNKDIQSMPGMFVNSLALKENIDLHSNYLHFLENIKINTLNAFSYQEYPLEALVADLKINRDLSRNPLFHVMLVMQNNEKNSLMLKDTVAEEIKVGNTVSKFDLTICIREQQGNFNMEFEYCTDLFLPETIDYMMRHMTNLLVELTKNPQKKLHEYSMLTENEKKNVLVEFNHTEQKFNDNLCIHEAFEQVVANLPDEIAIWHEGEHLTYHLLNEKANQLASWLSKQGITKGDFIAVITDKSIETIISIIAILKAGATYVPMDQSAPKQRLEYMLEDTNPAMVLSHNSAFDGWNKQKVSLKEWEFSSEPVNNQRIECGSEDVAYIIYTSGTTGKPKGVMLKHRGAINLANYHKIKYGINVNDRILQFSNFVFDASIWEILMALLNGASLYIPGDNTILDTTRFEDYVKDNKITVLTLPPQYYLQIQVPDVRLIITAGSESGQKILQQVSDSTQYINAYGPTEVTVCGTDWKWNKERISSNKIPIGKPIANTQVYIMQDDNICGIGIPGEICICGVGVAKGYLHMQELTDKKFVNNPFGTGKLYRTGDVGRWLADGNIEFLGRMDEQVKIRGYRIELQEIESVLRQKKDIINATIIIRKNSAGEDSIYAYYVAANPLASNEIREWLRLKLPEYMVPSYLIQLESIPMNQSGKVDKAKLPDIEIYDLQTFEEAVTKTQKELASMYETILMIPKAGRNTDFFGAGGHSLKAAKLLNNIEAKFGVRLTLKEIFMNSVIKRLAEYIEKAAKDINYEKISICEKKDFYPATRMQKSIYLVCQKADSTNYNMPQAVYFTGNLEVDRLRQAFQTLLERHEILRTSFHIENDEIVQKINEKVELEFIYAKDNCPEEKLIETFIRSFDLSVAPLMRVKVVKRNRGYLLLFDIHHIIADGISTSILAEEISSLYNGNLLKEVTLQYKDYSQWLQNCNYETQRKYWKDEMGEEIPILNFPLDKLRPKYQSFNGNRIVTNLDEELGSMIKKLSRTYNVTDYMIFLSAFMILLSKYARQEDIIVGSPMAGRFRKEIDQMLGMFVNTLPVRGHVDKTLTFADFLQQIKNKVLKTIENGEYPFWELVNDLNADTDISRNAIFDIVISMQNQEMVEWNLQNVGSTELREIKNRTSKFDLSLSINEKSGRYQLELEYCTDLFLEGTIVRLIKHYNSLLQDILESPDKVIEKISMIDDEELRILSRTFNFNKIDMMTECIHERFEKMVQQFPNQVAIIHNDRQLTYWELNEKTNRLAHYLQKLSIGRDDLVAVWGEKKIETIIAILGILKAGGAYVPIAPDYPKDRIEYILKDCNPKALLADVSITLNYDVPVVMIGKAIMEESNSTNPIHSNVPTDLAYVIYTSGTTGQPKGVMLEHKGLLNLNNHCRTNFGVNESEVVLQFANLVFDASVFEIALALLNGGSLCIVDKDIISDVKLFEQYLLEKGVSLLLLPPQYYLQVELPRIKRIITGGSASSIAVLEHVPANVIYTNAYGPTEITVYCTDWEKQSGKIPDKIPIGKPIENSTVYIMDKDELSGIGVPGELCVGGLGLARGYLNQPELTKKYFVENLQGERLFRTGDLARWLEDGNIEYMGRIDNQVKIRGYRIELEEIETVFRTVKGIEDVAVILKKTEGMDGTLYAYFTADIAMNQDDIKDSIAKKLPEYMIPQRMMQLEIIPVNQSGKIDINRLPDINIVSKNDYEEPDGEKEKLVAAVYKEILGLERVGKKDNFFELGGNSMKAIIAMNHLKKKGYKVNSQDMMRFPVVEKLASRLRYERGRALR